MLGSVVVSVLLVLGMLGSQGQGTLVKRCGKDLVRTVLSSCGNTRGRRSALEFGPRQSPVDSPGDSPGSILAWLGDEPLTGLDSSERGRELEQASTEGQPPEGATSAPDLPSKPPAAEFRGLVASTVSTRSLRSVKTEEICCQFGCDLKDLIRTYC